MKKKTRRFVAMMLAMVMILQQSNTLGALAVDTEVEAGTEASAVAVEKTTPSEAAAGPQVPETEMTAQEIAADEQFPKPGTDAPKSAETQVSESKETVLETVAGIQDVEADTTAQETAAETQVSEIETISEETGLPQTEAVAEKMGSETGTESQEIATEDLTEGGTQASESEVTALETATGIQNVETDIPTQETAVGIQTSEIETISEKTEFPQEEAVTEEAGTESGAESQEIATEDLTEGETPAPGTENTTEAVTETMTEQPAETSVEAEPVTEESAALEAKVTQEVFQKTVDNSIVPMVKYTVRISNRAASADAEGISLKVVLADALSYRKEGGETPELASFETLGSAIEATVFENEELSAADKEAYANGGVVLWKNQTVAAGEEKAFAFCAEVKAGQTDLNALKSLWLVNGESVTAENIQWANTKLLEIQPSIAEPQAYKYEDGKVEIKVTVPEGVELPYGAELKADPVPAGSKEYTDAATAVEAANPGVVFHEHVFYDIYFESDGKEVEPTGGEVSVQIKLKDTMKTATGNTSGEPTVTVSHMKDDGSLEDVTDEINLNQKDEVKSVRFSTDSFSIMGISAGVKDGYKTDDTLDDYSLEFLLRNFNVVSFGNVDLAVHCMGGILVKGNLSGFASGFADSARVTEESFVKGYVSFTGRCNSRNNYHPDGWAFYVGAGSAEKANEITADNDGNYTVLNGMGGFNSRPDGGCGPVLMNDNYVDWTTLFNSVDGTMDALAAKSMNTYTSDWDWSDVTIPAGTNVSLKTNGHKVKIKLEGDTTATTIINVIDGGEVSVPQVENMTSAEDGDSMSIVFTFPNATQVNIISELSPNFGHIIAPQAKINIGSCNYNGCVIGGDMAINGEGHMWPYTGGSMIPASGGFSAQKTVDGNTPAAGQTFNFSLEELKDGAWATVETKPNDGSKVAFSKILYTDTAEHWYLISEEAESGNYEYDDALYVIHVTVEESESDGMKVYNVKGTEYYKVNDGVTKDSLVSGTGVDVSKLTKKSGSDSVVFDNKELTRKEVQKVWAGDTDDVRPESIQVQLKADGKAYGGAVTLNAGNGWHYTWANLPKHDGTREISYTIEETGTVAGYVTTSEVAGDVTTITNTYDSKDTDMHVQKVWVDDNDRDGLRPKSIQVQLTADGKAYGDTVTLNEGNGWKYDWTGLPEKKDGSIISYDVKEVGSVTGYTTAYQTSGKMVTITNTHDIAKTSKSVRKAWNDDGDRDGLRPESIQVQLKADGVNYGSEVTLNEDNGWSHTWPDLPKNANSKEVTYTVEETGTVTGYTSASTVDGDTTTITNTHETGYTSMQVKKVWADEDDREGLRPESIQVQLMADGKASGGAVTLNEGNSWSYSWTKLPEKENGKAIVYTVEEIGMVSGYTTAYEASGNTVTITNTHAADETDRSVQKVWKDNNNQDGIRPEMIMVQLFADGKAYGDPVKLNESNGWAYTWEHLPKKSNGVVIQYTVEETDQVPGYTAESHVEGNMTVITNTHDGDITSHSVEKIWVDGDNQDGLRPESIQVQLFADGSEYGTPVELNNENSWKYEWSELPKKESGKDIIYTVQEIGEVTGYATAYTADAATGKVTITNTHTPATVEKTVTKKWVDNDDQDGLRPGKIEVQLLADGETYGEKVELNSDNEWRYTWKGLPEKAAGKAVVYTVEELGEIKGYTTAYDQATLTITNTHGTETTSKEAEKVWVDGENQDSLRPESIQVQLLADGAVYGEPVKLNADNNWKYTWTELPKKTAGKDVAYTVQELGEIKGYTTSYATDAETGKVTITNTHLLYTGITLGATKVFDRALTGNDFTFRLEELNADGTVKAGGVTAETKNKADGTVSFEPIQYKEAGTYYYKISEVIPTGEAKDASVLYDTTVKKVTVTVEEKDNKLSAKSDVEARDVVFANKLTSVRVSKVDVTTGAELEGAHIQILDKDGNVVEEWDSTKESHEVKGLKTGETYTLKETVAPNGYTVTDETTLTLKEDGTVDSGNTTTKSKDGVLLVEDSVNKISILKVDGSGKALAGAKLVIKDQDGKAVGDAWMTDGKVHDITGLAKGSYTLSEIEAPEGYQVSEDVPFKVTGKETAGQVITVEMKDAAIPKADKRSLTVTKHLRLDGISGEIGIRDAVYYVALFSDEAKTQRVSNVKPVVFKNSTASSVTFENLGKGTYYVGETDENGTPLVSKMINEKQTFYPEYDGSAKVEFEGDKSETASAEFTNVYMELTSGLYLSGQITITKRVLVNGKERASDATYYARVFSDAGLTEPASDVVALNLNGGSSVSATVKDLFIGMTLDGIQNYYVAETDENGVPLDPDSVTEFEISIDKSEVVLSANNSMQEVMITNSFTEEVETKSESGAESEAETGVETEVEAKEAPKTGDDTDFMRYLFLISCSAVIATVVFEEKRRKARRTRK